jgi:hypothetical protein
MDALPTGTTVTLRKYSVSRKMDIKSPNATAATAAISSPIYSFAAELELHSTTGVKIAKIVKSPWFWVKTADLYDCQDKKFAEIQWNVDNWWSFNAHVTGFEVFDAAGNKVADMEKVKSESAVLRHNSVGLSVNGQLVLQLSMEEAPWHERILGGIFGSYTTAQLSIVATATPIPALLTDPRFLSLAMASELAPGSLGPFWQIAQFCLGPLLLCCCCCCAFCGKNEKTPAQHQDVTEEQKPLVTTVSQARSPYPAQGPPPPAKGGVAGWLSCCSRKAAVTPQGAGQP